MQRAFCRRRARDLKTEIDAYILLQSGRQASAAIKLPHYFNSRPGKGDISPLRKELIFQDGVSGRYYLQVD